MHTRTDAFVLCPRIELIFVPHVQPPCTYAQSSGTVSRQRFLQRAHLGPPPGPGMIYASK